MAMVLMMYCAASEVISAPESPQLSVFHQAQVRNLTSGNEIGPEDTNDELDSTSRIISAAPFAFPRRDSYARATSSNSLSRSALRLASPAACSAEITIVLFVVELICIATPS